MALHWLWPEEIAAHSSVSSLSTNSSGIGGATSFGSPPGSGDKLVATLPLTASGVTPAVIASGTSNAFNVTASTGVQLTIGASPAGPAFMVDGVSYSAPVTLTWVVGSQHTLAVASPQDIAGTQYSFASWSDGGAVSHTVTATADTFGFTVTFNLAYLLTVSAKPAQGGTVSPPSGSYYPARQRRESDRDAERWLYVRGLDRQRGVSVQPKHHHHDERAGDCHRELHGHS